MSSARQNHLITTQAHRWLKSGAMIRESLEQTPRISRQLLCCCVVLSLFTCSAVTAQTLPSPWLSADIGNTEIAGRSTYSSGTFTITAAGDIGWTSDQFHFVYRTVTGDLEIVARVVSITTEAHPLSEAGVMIRESLTAESPHAMMVGSAGTRYAFQRRVNTAGSSDSTGGSGTTPGWVRLVRKGDLFSAYYSTDDTSWQLVGSDTIPMGDTVYVGLTVNSHSKPVAATGEIDSVRLTEASVPNFPPVISITAPIANEQYVAPASIAITASATDPEGAMLSVDFYANQTLISRDTTAPYSATFATSTPGAYSLTAVAHDADGNSTTSGAVPVTVQDVSNQVPTVSLTSPASGAQFSAPAAINMTAIASDPENQLARVEFLSGNTVLGTDTTEPYAWTWSSVPAGTYSVTARAYDSDGASATSTAVSVTVATIATAAPRLVVFTASADHATNVTSYFFEVFAAGANLATAVAIASSDLGKPTPDANEDITVDQSVLFSALAVGNYVATVTAVGPGGRTRSAPLSFTR